MFLGGIISVGLGTSIGLVGGLAGRRSFELLTRSSIADERIKIYGVWKRSLIVGLLTSAATLLNFVIENATHDVALIGVTCLVVSFVSTLLYIVGSLAIVTKFGTAILEAGELSLAVTIILLALLYVCGALWITLVILGGCLLLALTVLNGLWIYRLR